MLKKTHLVLYLCGGVENSIVRLGYPGRGRLGKER